MSVIHTIMCLCAAVWQEAACTGDEAMSRLVLEARVAEMAHVRRAAADAFASARDSRLLRGDALGVRLVGARIFNVKYYYEKCLQNQSFARS